ncbi:MAG TPA: DNA mismatch repair endonuclease MutL [Dehalococcoidia bacterium]|jgi:DNA mismatch repair protein MutL|nr:DNA mismatch repair protein MutL [Chloroflexota bacterium]MDP5876084.1 DNA mismatch repair endonuclease MutL [Dehalococcoidia bacterium]MDP6272832.1 DNA mismatch repair endonuclease MutL [Dehalococcoidia bacterium]MDP7160616.1 DNA mismatch repair endonuclease MutL [Dehalococcoidia bacterium]MDP7213662.1 DNA mismatch repair endonuclease MutL [Dehalococcoidia bacterium]
MSIRLLDDATAARIAAGEVIERPASVVKELVENALDAGATRIEVEIDGGGTDLIRVVDNGTGIAVGELELAFERFATSKVDATSDLLGIATLGFRGEALPSIASVSRVEATSRAAGQDSGERLLLEFGERLEFGKTGVPAGTAVAVRGLFSNVPARKKFLRSAGAELGRIQTLVTSYALVRSDVAFRLTAAGRERLVTPGGDDLRGAVAGTYGSRVAEAMLELPEPEPFADGVTPAFSVGGLAGAPSISRGNRGFITLAVNGRWIQNRRISYAIEQAYHGFLGERRSPIAVVLVKAPLNDVDVNVHPAKTEVRFLREDLVFGEVQRAVRSLLIATTPVPAFRPTTRPHAFSGSGGSSSGGPSVVNAPRTDLEQNPLWPSRHDEGTSGPETGVHVDATDAWMAGDQVSAVTPQQTQRETLPVLRMIGQAQETYLIAEGPDGVYVIDQHAAHERVRYEEITDALNTGTADAQQLLEPEPVGLDPRQEELLSDQLELIAGMGFVVESFGPATVLIRAIPRMLADRTAAAGDAFRGLLDEVATGGRYEAWRDRMIATLACHSSVRAGMRLSEDEGRALLRSLEKAEQPHTCPHGRPTMIHMSQPDLERGFGRR